MFFEPEREHFFRPLSGKHRELSVQCLRTLYERLNGPSADYTQNLTRDLLKDLLSSVVQSYFLTIKIGEPEEDETFFSEEMDAGQRTLALVRTFIRDGWLETFGDRAGLVTAYRFTRAGKLFSEALWSLDRLRSRSRQRNVRGCRNALEAALKNRDAYDLVDAYDYAEKIISDLSDGVDYFQQMVRRLMSEASSTPWEEFMEFLDRFEKDFKKQLTADSIERHRQAIRETIHRLRGIEEESYRMLEGQLSDIASWAEEERFGDSTFQWLLDRIEDMVELACSSKNPELIRAMNTYMRRAAGIVQQAMMFRTGQTKHAYLQVINRVASLEGDIQTRLLETVGARIAGAEFRLLDPVSFKLRTLSERRKAVTLTVKPRITRESQLAAAMDRAEAGAFSLSSEDVLSMLLAELRLRGRPFRLSTLSLRNAMDVLQAMQAVEAIRSDPGSSMKATRLDSKLCAEAYIGNDYLIELNHVD